MSGRSFLRAVNLKDDLGSPARLVHYHPTRKSAPVIRAVLNGGCTIVIAAYGSGKSLAAGIGGLLVENAPTLGYTLKPVIDRLQAVDPELHSLVQSRFTSSERGRVAVLSGYVRNVVNELAQAIGLEKEPRTVKALIKEIKSIQGIDRLTIVWDEFGRHLEGLIAEGKSRDLAVLQDLAELVDRSDDPSVGLTLLMHQNLLAYAGSLNQTSRTEWKKIEGRFRPIRFVEDSRELYELIAEAIAHRSHVSIPPELMPELRKIAEGAVDAGWFDGLEDFERVVGLLVRAYPVSAAALQVLPRLVSRVGQNERSLFTFIEEADFSAPVGATEVYEAFSEAMRSDVGIGGTHRRWVETESARSRANTDFEREALAAACLLQLGSDGERRKLTREALELAVRSRAGSQRKSRAAIEALIDRNLLLYRKLNNDVSVWHGADVDVASRIRDERVRRAETFDLVSFLESNHPAPFVRPTRHNVERGTSRYLSGMYLSARKLLNIAQIGELAPTHDEWARVVYVLADAAEDLAKVRKRICNDWRELDRVVFVLPNESIPVEDAALEVAALSALRNDDDLIGKDPLVSQEINELLAVARSHLSLVLHRLTTDRPTAASWYHRGEELRVGAERPAGIVASELMDDWFNLTPRIVNDQLMRGRISRQMQTARIRVLLKIMEHAEKPHLGYSEDDSSAEASIARTVLERTGLHRSSNGVGYFAEPEDITNNPGLSASWMHVANFFRTPSLEPKPLSDIINTLASKPIGMPAGVIPLIIMAGYRAFARMVALRTDGTYVPDILGFDASRMFLEPERHTVTVYASDEARVRYLSEIAFVFSHKRPDARDELVRFARDAFEVWRRSLPEGAKRSFRLSKKARAFLDTVNEANDPAELFLHDLPNAFGIGGGSRSFDAVISAVEEVRNEIDRLVKGYLEEAVSILNDVLRVGETEDAVTGIQSWVDCIDVDTLLQRDDLKITDKAILRTARDTLNGRYTPHSLARAVSSILIQRGIEQWQDSTGDHFRRQLRECRSRIEDTAIAASTSDKRIVPLIQSRINDLQAILARVHPARSRLVGGES